MKAAKWVDRLVTALCELEGVDKIALSAHSGDRYFHYSQDRWEKYIQVFLHHQSVQVLTRLTRPRVQFWKSQPFEQLCPDAMAREIAWKMQRSDLSEQ